MTDYLSTILARKRRENRRRSRHRGHMRSATRQAEPARRERALAALRRAPSAPPAVIAEVKFRSPSAGEIRRAFPGEGVRVARAYERGGASVVSVLADGPGFGGSPLLVRRVARAVSIPVLYKEFVIESLQIDLAYDVGASLVLLLVRALDDETLRALIDQTRTLGMEPVVEAANADEVDRALSAGSSIVGVNARDLASFRVDKRRARECVERIPDSCIAVFMSGVRTVEDFREIAAGRADAVLIGEGLMRAADPGSRLQELLASLRSADDQAGS